MLIRIAPVVYLVIGLLVAAQHNYFTDVNTISRVLSAALAVIFWPLVLIGVNLVVI
jgi:hypothetical protein